MLANFGVGDRKVALGAGLVLGVINVGRAIENAL